MLSPSPSPPAIAAAFSSPAGWSSLQCVVVGATLCAISTMLSGLGNTWATSVGRHLVLRRASAAAPAVFDWGREMLPNLDDWFWLPDLMLLPMFVALVWIIAVQPSSPASGPAGSPSSSLSSGALKPAVPAAAPSSTRALRFLWLSGMYSSVLSLRTASVCMTILGASPRCQAHQGGALLTADNAGFALNTGCFDLMFSGHSSFSALIGALAVVSRVFSVQSKAILVSLTILSALSNVAVGDHYSADVWIGVYVGASVVAICRAQIREVF